MTAEGYNAQWPLRRVIESLLLVTLAPELHVLIPGLIDEVSERPDVAAFANKRWGELSVGEGNLVAREVGVVALRVTAAAKVSPGGLH